MIHRACSGGLVLLAILAMPGFSPAAGLLLQEGDAGDRALSRVDETHTKAKAYSCDLEITNQEPGKDERKLGQRIRVKGPKCLIEFTAPDDMKGTKILVLGPGQLYVYLPAFGKVRRLATGTKELTFFGMAYKMEDYFFNSFSDRYAATLVPSPAEELRLVLTPKPGQETVYAKVEMSVQKDKSVPTLLKYYDGKGMLLKTETRADYTSQSDVTLATEFKMVDHTQEGRWTKLVRKTLTVGEDIPDDLFTIRNLGK